MKDRKRQYRRYMQEVKLIKRLNRASLNWWGRFTTINDNRIAKPNITDYIGLSHYKLYKTTTTTRWDSSNKSKYSPNRFNCWRSDHDRNTRESDKKEFLNILREYGLK